MPETEDKPLGLFEITKMKLLKNLLYKTSLFFVFFLVNPVGMHRISGGPDNPAFFLYPVSGRISG
jgi:hypothetical protein